MKNQSLLLKITGCALLLVLAALLYQQVSCFGYSPYGKEPEKWEDVYKGFYYLKLLGIGLISIFFVCVVLDNPQSKYSKYAIVVALVALGALMISTLGSLKLQEIVKKLDALYEKGGYGAERRINNLKEKATDIGLWVHYLSYAKGLLIVALMLAYQSIQGKSKMLLPIIFASVAILTSYIRPAGDHEDYKLVAYSFAVVGLCLFFASFACLMFTYSNKDKVNPFEKTKVDFVEVAALVLILLAIVFFCKEWAFEKIEKQPHHDYEYYDDYGYDSGYVAERETSPFVYGGYAFPFVSLGMILLICAAYVVFTRTNDSRKLLGAGMIVFAALAVAYVYFGAKLHVGPNESTRRLSDLPNELDKKVKIWKMLVFLGASVAAGIFMITSAKDETTTRRPFAKNEEDIQEIAE